MMATQELVVPRSMPITGPVFLEANPAVRAFLKIVRIISEEILLIIIIVNLNLEANINSIKIKCSIF